MTRNLCVTQKVKTDFGSMFISIDLSPEGRPVGGRIATPGKEPTSQVHCLLETLSDALDEALAEAGALRALER